MNTLKNLLSLNDDERLLAEVRTYQEKLISNAEEPIWERKWLTIEEAAAYSGIGSCVSCLIKQVVPLQYG